MLRESSVSVALSSETSRPVVIESNMAAVVWANQRGGRYTDLA